MDLRTCWACDIEKPMSAFAFDNMRRGTRQRHCRSCHAKSRRAHYLANKPEYIRRAIAQVRARREENRRQMYQYFRTHPCVDCGESDVVVLEFDHRDPSDKIRDVASLAATRRWPNVLLEIQKCDVRCVNCHRRRTARQFGWSKLRPRDRI
jgi:hypothetical protein